MTWKWFRRIKDAGREKTEKVIGGAREGVGTFTGRSIKERLDEYSEVYGEVLLGIHGELLMQKRQLEGIQSSVEEKLEAQRKSMDALRSMIAELPIHHPPGRHSPMEEPENILSSHRELIDSLRQETLDLRTGLRRAYGVTAVALILAVLGFFV
jgi:hypothetical protein